MAQRGYDYVSHFYDIIHTILGESFLRLDTLPYGREGERHFSLSLTGWPILERPTSQPLWDHYFGLRQVCNPSTSNLTGKALAPRPSTAFSTWTCFPESQYRKRNPPPPAPSSLPPIAPSSLPRYRTFPTSSVVLASHS